MGLAKRVAMQQQEQGWAFSGEDVCVDCVDDYALEAAIKKDEVADVPCSFCGRIGSAPLDTLVAAFVNGLHVEYADPDNEGVYWDGREGGYQWETKDTSDLVDEYSHVLVGDDLIEAVTRSIDFKLWVEKGFVFPRRDEALLSSWKRFCETVKHRTRYVFWLQPDEDYEDERYGEVPASRILNKIGEFISEIDLIQEIPEGTKFWRARAHDNRLLASAKDIGTTPIEYATQSNRMNPAGIPMFYGSDDREHAIREVLAIDSKAYVTAAQFEVVDTLHIVNLVNLPAIPSVFDPDRGSMWRHYSFLHNFVEQLSRPIDRTREQIDYVPTQILTEYLIHILDPGKKIAGMSFKSAIDENLNIVLDVTNDRCLDAKDEPRATEGWPTLRLIPESIETQRIQDGR